MKTDVCEWVGMYVSYQIPTILSRLMRKDLEWRELKEEMKVTWRKVVAQNYHKALDHRSFYFKQMDKKNLTTRGMGVC